MLLLTIDVFLIVEVHENAVFLLASMQMLCSSFNNKNITHHAFGIAYNMHTEKDITAT